MTFINTREITEDKSINKQNTIQVVNLVLQDPAVESSLLPVMVEAESVLICYSDVIRSRYRSPETSHGVTSFHLLHTSSLQGLVLRVNDLVHRSRPDPVTSCGLWYEDDGHLLVDLHLGSGQTDSSQSVEQGLHGQQGGEILL